MEEQTSMQGQSQPTPEAMPTAPVAEKHYAGFWMRVLAGIIDGIILSVVGSLFGATQTSGTMVSVQFTGWKMLIPLIYYLGFWMWLSATPGYMALKLRIVDEGGKRMTPVAAIIRYFAQILSALPLFLGYFWIGWDKKKQAWHDKLAKVYVVKE